MRVFLLRENTRDSKRQRHVLYVCIRMETGPFVVQLLTPVIFSQNKLMWLNWTRTQAVSSLRAGDTLAKPFLRHFQLSHSSLLSASWIDIGAKFKQMARRAKRHALLSVVNNIRTIIIIAFRKNKTKLLWRGTQAFNKILNSWLLSLVVANSSKTATQPIRVRNVNCLEDD